MPAKNVIKVYLEQGYYHIYNRGVEKRTIFIDNQDYKVFLHFLKRYLTPAPKMDVDFVPRFKTDLFDKIELICYCLMPNHFHLLVKQTEKNTIVTFMRALTNSYTRYFNQKYTRVGPLFQGAYKGILITEEPYLLHLTRYIHLNPLEIEPNEVAPRTRSHLERITVYPYSSYGEYLGRRNTSWIKPEMILSFFKTAQLSNTNMRDCNSYQGFVENYNEDPINMVGELAIDLE
jgi:putative transposase